MVRQTSPLAAVQNFLVRVADVLDAVYFKLAELLGLSRRFGKRLSITYLAVATTFAFTILISLIVSIATTAKSKSEGPEPAITTIAINASTSIVTPEETQSASVSLTYPPTIVSSKSTRTSFITKTTIKPRTSPSTSPRVPPSPATQTKAQTSSSSRSTQKSSTTTTRKPQTSSSGTTQTTTPGTTIKPPETPVHCMFVGDVLNLGKETTAKELYWQEKEMIFQIAESVINWYDSNTVASWAYGHVKTTRSFRQQFKEFTHNWLTFADHTAELMKFYNDTPVLPSGGNDAVFTEINETEDDDQRANCLVFLSAMTNAEGYTIKPNYEHYKRIVVVNMAGGDFSKILDDNRGTVVPVSQPYNHEDRKNSNKVFKAIVEGFLNY